MNAIYSNYFLRLHRKAACRCIALRILVTRTYWLLILGTKSSCHSAPIHSVAELPMRPESGDHLLDHTTVSASCLFSSCAVRTFDSLNDVTCSMYYIRRAV
jgi:hypothetical protein